MGVPRSYESSTPQATGAKATEAIKARRDSFVFPPQCEMTKPLFLLNIVLKANSQVSLSAVFLKSYFVKFLTWE